MAEIRYMTHGYSQYFKILGDLSFSISANQVSFSDVTVDFSITENKIRKVCDISYVPLKYQQILVSSKDVTFRAFVDKVTFKNLGTEFVEMKLTLLSPFKMATIRTNSINGTFTVKQAIERILEPLINDDFTIEAEEFDNGQITLNYTIQTIENLMNTICQKRGLTWWIDQNSRIYIYSIERLLGKSSKLLINEETRKEGILSISPKVVNVDYANVINFKNVRLICQGNPLVKEINVKTGDIVQFDTPVVIDENTLRTIKNEYASDYGQDIFGISIDGEYIKIQKSNNQYVKSSGIAYSDDETTTAKVILQRDNFFNNLITGFKWNSANKRISIPFSDTCLKYTEMTFYHNGEIEKMQDLISNSGEIEKTIDYASKWTTLQQINDYADSIIQQNSNEISEVELIVDKNLKLNLGNIIQFDLPKYMLEGTFAITEIKVTKTNVTKWTIKLKKSNFIYNYIDIFRKVEAEITSSKEIIISSFINERIDENITFTNWHIEPVEDIEIGGVFG